MAANLIGVLGLVVMAVLFVALGLGERMGGACHACPELEEPSGCGGCPLADEMDRESPVETHVRREARR